MRNLLIGIIVGLMVTTVAPTTATPDLWIWRDRWNVMGSFFQDGYITGVFDAVGYLGFYTIFDFGRPLESTIREAHRGMVNLQTIKPAVEWTNAAVAKGTDPLTIVAAMIIETLGPEPAPDLSHHNGAIWKDRWTRDWYPGFGADGYVAGVFDLIRSLDNAGKSPKVLRADVGRAAGMTYRFAQRTHRAHPVLADIIKAIRSGISRSEDPTENMAMVIFDALRQY